MGFAILCVLAVYGAGAMLMTIWDAIIRKKRCCGCQVSMTAKIHGGACCEWVARQLLYEAENGPLPIAQITFLTEDEETLDILHRLCWEREHVFIIKESEDALRADHRNGA